MSRRNPTWSSMTFTSCSMRNTPERAWISHKPTPLLLPDKDASSHISGSLHRHLQPLRVRKSRTSHRAHLSSSPSRNNLFAIRPRSASWARALLNDKPAASKTIFHLFANTLLPFSHLPLLSCSFHIQQWLASSSLSKALAWEVWEALSTKNSTQIFCFRRQYNHSTIKKIKFVAQHYFTTTSRRLNQWFDCEKHNFSVFVSIYYDFYFNIFSIDLNENDLINAINVRIHL